jgi:MscS family membrane protein
MITPLVVIHYTLVVFLGIDSKSINISKIFATLYVVLVALLLYRITDTVAYLRIEQMKKSKILRNEVINLTIKVIHGFIITIAIIAMLKIAGVNLTALLSGLGIAGAAVAFAAKDSIANIFGSVSILLGDVFEQGDWIETKDVNGTVVEIGLRATTIRTFENALISIPNFNLSDTAVTNWSRRNIGRRIKMSVGVTYESDFGDIRKAIEDIREMLNNHPDIAQKATSGFRVAREARLVSAEDFKGVKNTILVYMDEFADSSINILIYCFSRTVNWMEWLRVKEDVMYKIEEILRKNNLEFAYPAIMLHKSGQKEAVEMGASSSGTLP